MRTEPESGAMGFLPFAIGGGLVLLLAILVGILLARRRSLRRHDPSAGPVEA